MAKLIAELCQNHNGDINILEEMVAAAAESGADYAKIQSIDSGELTFRDRFENGLIEGIKYSIKRFHELDSFYFLLETIIIPFYSLFYAGKGLGDIYPFFWEFAKYNHPFLAFIISCIAYPFWTSFFFKR